MNGMYEVAKSEHRLAARTGGPALISPDNAARMMVVARLVRVIATLIPAAKQRHATTGETDGKRNTRARPNEAPAQKNGKMKPPR